MIGHGLAVPGGSTGTPATTGALAAAAPVVKLCTSLSIMRGKAQPDSKPTTVMAKANLLRDFIVWCWI